MDDTTNQNIIETDTPMSDVVSENEANNACNADSDSNSNSLNTQNFTLLQQRRLPQTVTCSSCCPSMDLVALGFGINHAKKENSTIGNSIANCEIEINANLETTVQIQVSTTVVIHRTLTWQKLMTLGPSDFSSVIQQDYETLTINRANIKKDKTNEEEEKDIEGNIGTKTSIENAPTGVTALCWSPDGRFIAIGMADGSTIIYDVETCANPTTPPLPMHCIPPSNLKPDDLPSLSQNYNKHHLGVSNKYILQKGRIPTTTSIQEVCDEGMLSTGSVSIQSSSKKKSKISITSQFSPAVTRSKSTARIKRLIRTSGKTPGEETESRTMHNIKNEIDTGINPECLGIGWKASSITALTWARVVPKHKDWIYTDQEKQEDESWKYRSYFLDRSSFFLPPSAYNAGNNENMNMSGEECDSFNNSHKYRPDCQTPLNLLCVATCTNGLHLYLHGQYRILSLSTPVALSNTDTSIECSSNLSTIAISTDEYGDSGLNVTLYTIPTLQRDRHDLQVISSSYCSIASHLSTIEKGLKETIRIWSNSLRPLDLKFEQLTKLLRDYNIISDRSDELKSEVDDPVLATATAVRKELLNFILSGHSNHNSVTASAMDQFFTHPLMNDQLLQRMQRTLEANIAGVESTIRKKILSPVKSLVYDTEELHGLVKRMNANGLSLTRRDEKVDQLQSLMDTCSSKKLYQASEILYITVEQCLSQVIDFRFRIVLIMKWIRGTASQLKARGTACDSALRGNARKRRVSQNILHRVASYLSTPLLSESVDQTSSKSKRGITECILGVLLSDQFVKNKIYANRHPCSDFHDGAHSDKLIIGQKSGYNSHIQNPTVRFALETVCQLAQKLFEEPHDKIIRSLNKFDMIFEHVRSNPQGRKIKTIHKRLGGLYRNTQNPTSFVPSAVTKSNGKATNSKSVYWIFLACACSNTFQGNQMVQIVAIPTKSDGDDVEDFYLKSFVMIPKNFQVVDIDFYGDDGNSALTSKMSHSKSEGRQSLGLILERSMSLESSDSDQRKSEELWIFKYDNLRYRPITQKIKNGRIVVGKFDEVNDFNTTLLTNEHLFQHDGSHYIKAKWRKLDSTKKKFSTKRSATSNSSRLLLSGSRGIGGMISDNKNTIDLFDLEEDEDEDEDEDEE